MVYLGELPEDADGFPHCNTEVLHRPGTCQFCDLFPNRQALRKFSGSGFTPAEANGWGGNVAVPAGEVPVLVNRTQESGIGGCQVVERRTWEWLVCPACIRFKFSPIHWFYRAIGICDGRNGW